MANNHKQSTPTPVWNDARAPRFAKPAKSQHFDVVVVGGGITGLTAAYLLKRAGKKVCVLERLRIGAVDTGHTTAHLTMVTDLRLSRMARQFGKDAARLAWQGGAAAINSIEEIVHKLRIDCQFSRIPGYLHASLNTQEDEAKELESEAELASELGFDARFLSTVPYFGKPGIRFSNQAKFHPAKYIFALAEAVDGKGSAVFEEADVSEVTDDPLTIKVNRYAMKCEHVVIATHVPLMGKTGLVSATLFQTKLAPYSSYVVGAKLPHGTVPEASFWDTTDPYYYLRVDAGPKTDYAIFGGQDHKTGQEHDVQSRYAALRERFYTLIPEAKAVDHEWAGQVIETNDGLPYIGQTAERQFVATGFAGNGMTFGTLGAMMACDWVLKRDNPWQDLFSVNRKPLRGGVWDYLKQNFDYPYYLLRDHLAPPEGDSPQSVKRGDGKVLLIDGQRVACSRNKKGQLVQVSAVCTHMGCLVHWNNAEQTWDCPCHGSRFDAQGKVFAGPAESSLELIQAAAADVKKPQAPKKKAASARKKKPQRQRFAAARKGR